jgi:phospholipid-binding lipoprotein MlaA
MSTLHAKIRSAVLVFLTVVVVSGCSTAPILEGSEPEEPFFPADRILSPDINYAAEVNDPWEGFNRRVYNFNYQFDKYIFLPAVYVYQLITPDFVETGIHNFFTNYRNIPTLINSILQLSPRKTVETTGRLAVNTTIGLLGFLDPATAMGIPQHLEDMGQTLGYWGLGPGPFLVLPIMGPSSVRDGIGAGVDWYMVTVIRDQLVDPELWQTLLFGTLYGIDTRANVGFRYYETGSPFEYELVRWLWTTKREIDIAK